MLKFRIYRYRRVTYLPILSAVSIVDDGPKYLTIGRMYELIWLGIVLDIILPSHKPKKAWSTDKRRISP